jgi:excisionase family DNA binding protein
MVQRNPQWSIKVSDHVYLTPLEAAAYLHSSISTLAKLRVYGGGPVFHRIGRAIRYRKADLDQFMELTRASSTSVFQKDGGQS